MSDYLLLSCIDWFSLILKAYKTIPSECGFLSVCYFCIVDLRHKRMVTMVLCLRFIVKAEKKRLHTLCR